MRRNRKLMAVMVALVCAGTMAQAGVVTTTTPFTGTTLTTDFSGQGSQTLPWTDSYGRIVSSTDVTWNSNSALFTQNFNSSTIVFSNLSTDTVGIGFSQGSMDGELPGAIAQAVFSNGDVWTGPVSLSADPEFFGFLTDTPFTSATITWTGPTVYISNFTTRAAPPVPEPSTLIGSTLLAAGLVVTAYRRRSRRPRPA